jgi:hypothetical protein
MAPNHPTTPATRPPTTTGTADGHTAGAGGVVRVHGEITNNRDRMTIEGTIKRPIASRRVTVQPAEVQSVCFRCGPCGYHIRHMWDVAPGAHAKVVGSVHPGDASWSSAWTAPCRRSPSRRKCVYMYLRCSFSVDAFRLLSWRWSAERWTRSAPSMS